MITASILGKESLELGPANIYVKPLIVSSVATDWADVSDWIYLGETESSTLRLITSKTDLNSSQKGTRPADKVVTGQQAQIETNLGQAYLERLEEIQQGLYLKKTGETVEQWQFTKRLGEQDSDVLFWVKMVKINAGIESTNLLDIAYMKAAPMTEQAELTFDAATQRFYGLLLEAYENDTGAYAVSDDSGRPAYAWSGDLAA